jgi:uncharacterized protein involved in exopolysaccharide biosynthesis
MYPAQDSISVTRRPMDFQDYVDMARRHSSWIAGPAFAALVVSVIVAFLWQDTYVSKAIIRVVPAQVPTQLVPGQINLEMSARINDMVQTVLSRTTLTNIVTSLQLYPEQQQSRPIADIVEKMRKNVRVGAVQNLQTSGRDTVTAFEITFAYYDRFHAKRALDEIINNLINVSEAASLRRTQQTTEFLDAQLRKAKEDLEEIENKLTSFRVRSAGTLPDQLGANVEQLRAVQSQLSASNEAVSRINQTKLLLESEIRSLRDQMNALGSAPDQARAHVKSERLAQIEREVVRGENLISGLLQQYTETHPDVVNAQSQLANLIAKREQMAKEEAENRPVISSEKVLTPNDRKAAAQIEYNIRKIQSQVEAQNLEMERRLSEQKRLSEISATLQGRIQGVPASEQAYAELTRDYALAKAHYHDLNVKKAQSEMAVSLAQRRQSEVLEKLEDASSPIDPSKPHRPLIVGVGSGLGLLIGLALASAREMKDASLKNLKDVRAYTRMPVLASVPLLENDSVARRRRRIGWLAWSTAVVCGVTLMAGSVLYYYTYIRM